MKVHALIAEQTVVGADERVWTVGIRWLPRRPRRLGWGPGRTTADGPRPDPEWIGLMNGIVPDDYPVLLVIAAVIAALVFAWFVILPIAIFALDLVFIVLLAAAGVVWSLHEGRPAG